MRCCLYDDYDNIHIYDYEFYVCFFDCCVYYEFYVCFFDYCVYYEYYVNCFDYDFHILLDEQPNDFYHSGCLLFHRRLFPDHRDKLGVL